MWKGTCSPSMASIHSIHQNSSIHDPPSIQPSMIYHASFLKDQGSLHFTKYQTSITTAQGMKNLQELLCLRRETAVGKCQRCNWDGHDFLWLFKPQKVEGCAMKLVWNLNAHINSYMFHTFKSYPNLIRPFPPQKKKNACSTNLVRFIGTEHHSLLNVLVNLRGH